MICEWNLELAYFGEQKDLNFDDLAGPVKKMAIPQHGPQNNYGHKISKRFIQADYSNNKAHTLAIKLATDRAIFTCFLAFPRPRPC